MSLVALFSLSFGAFKAATSFRFMLFHCLLWLFLLQLRQHPSHLWPISHRAHGTDRYLHAAHCLAATLLTSKTGSPSCLLGNGGPEQAAFAALPWLTMTAGWSTSLFLLIPEQRGVECGGNVLYSILPCAFPPHYLSLWNRRIMQLSTRLHLLIHTVHV